MLLVLADRVASRGPKPRPEIRAGSRRRGRGRGPEREKTQITQTLGRQLEAHVE